MVELGKDVKGLAVGDRVFVNQGQALRDMSRMATVGGRKVLNSRRARGRSRPAPRSIATTARARASTRIQNRIRGTISTDTQLVLDRQALADA